MYAFVTGTSRGIGKEICLRLAESGITVFAQSRSSTEFSHKGIIPVCADISNAEGIETVVRIIERNKAQISLVIHNAATLIQKPFTEISQADLLQVYQVNVFSPFMLTQKLLPYLSVSAHVLMISSMGGFQGSAKFPGLSAYSSSKAALSNLAECLAEEFKDKKIFFNSLHLGAVNTGMLKEAFPGYHAPVDPDSMAEYIAWFGINGHRWFNGKCIPVSCSTP
jgi:NAD(P)-dependent dehydrogenase (short-subunit alcohol dehydrogenase family)